MNKIFMTVSMLLMSALMLVSCEGDNNTSMDAGFFMTFDKNVIQCNGEDVVTLSATLDGKDVTSDAIFYLVEGEVLTPMTSNKFSTDKDGKYAFRASYLTFDTQVPVVVTAIDAPIPSVAVDPAPSNTSFVHRAFLNQYTGTGCGFCPGMVYVLRELLADQQMKDKAVIAAIHNYNPNDPASISFPAPQGGWPYLSVDMSQGFIYQQGIGELVSIVNSIVGRPAKVGLSANPVVTDDILVVTIEVKAAETGEYNLGVWFMQDNVYGQQTIADQLAHLRGDETLNYHHNCVRYADSEYNASYAGYPLGEIKAGETASRTFVLDIDKKTWRLKDMNNLHFAAFVSARSGKGFNVLNVVDCKYNEPTPFEYK